jgi:hypothetical protein
VISGGLMMTVDGPGGIPPGGKSQAGDYVVVVQSPSWFTAEELEVIIDGVTTETRPLTPIAGPGPGKRYEARVAVAATSNKPRHYVIFHARGITVIVDGSQVPMVYADDKIDITRAFINDFNSKNPATASVTP